MTAKNPRKSDVARWVATFAETEPSRYMVEDHKRWRRDRDKARGMLSSWGLDTNGNPKPEAAPVAP